MNKDQYKAKSSRIRWLMHRANECAKLDLNWTGQRYFSLASEKQGVFPFRFLMQPEPLKADLARRLDEFKDSKEFGY